MVVISNTNSRDPKKPARKELNWENPKAPEDAKDKREAEKLLRQKKEADLRKEKLSGNPENDK